MIHDIVSAGLQRIYAEDYDSQKDYITKVCQQVRGMEPDVVLKALGVFVPNNDYLLHFFGQGALNEDYEIYDFEKNCMWTHQLIFPIRDVVDNVVGLVGFSPYNYLEAHETKDWSLNYYTYSSSRVFKKGKYLFYLPGTIDRALQDGYLILADGVFDTLSIAACGFNAAGFLGSFVSEEVVSILRFIPKIVLAMDNDSAGLQLYDRLKRRLNNVIFLKQGVTKDADDILKSAQREDYIRAINQVIYETVNLNKVVCFGKTKNAQH